MERFFERLDGLATIGNESRLALWLDRAIFVFLVLTFVSAPHSIAATQSCSESAGTSVARPPDDSRSAGMSLATTGLPAANASSTGRP
jgi:hypothetical protein